MRNGSGKRAPDALTPGRWLVGADGAWRAVDPDAPFLPSGAVDVRVLDRVANVQWSVEETPEGAIHAVAHWLEDRHRENPSIPVALRYWYAAWSAEVYESPRRAADRMRILAAFSETAPFGQESRMRLPLDRAYEGEPETRFVVETWLRKGGRAGTGDDDALMPLLPHVLIFRRVANDESFVYAHAGRRTVSAALLGDDWPAHVIGRTAEDCWSDDRYEAAVCADYGRVMDRDEARYDQFRAIFQPPGREALWLNYERLLLPWRMPNGERVLMVMAAQRQNLAIPFLGAGGR